MLLWLLENRGSVSFANLLFMIAAYAVMVLVMLPIHELAHAFAAHKLGDDTAKWNGRLTLNPMAHLDLQGTLMLVLFGVGYARPVPINPYNFRNPRKGMALSALAGPVSNLLMAVLSVGVFRLCVALIPNAMVLAYLYLILIDVFAWINIRLAVFNLLPIPPLDGSKIFGYFLPDRLVYTMERYSRQISLLLMVLLFVGVLDRPLSFLTNLIGGAIFRLFGF
ncbi:MAG: site-2 protease family protein [Clostridia bacterium]|nr:site-2 protease family protein [Clostridia bacterium]